MAINQLDNVYRKHKSCDCELRFNNNQNKYRMYCLDHNKWLHTLTDQEANVYFELLDCGEIV